MDTSRESCRLFCFFLPLRPSGAGQAFGFSDLSVAVIPAQAGIQGQVTGFGALDSRFRGNDRGEKGNSLAKCNCPGQGRQKPEYSVTTIIDDRDETFAGAAKWAPSLRWALAGLCLSMLM